MDLNSMLNTGEPPAQPPSQNASPTVQRHALPPAFGAPAGANGQSTSFAGQQTQQSTPQYAPPSQDHRSPSGSLGMQGKGLTPLQTPTQSMSGQYPYPPHPSQSPVAIPGQYQSHPGHAVTTPGGRPPSHGFQQPPTPSQYSQPGMQPALQNSSNSNPYNTNSLSSTPPSRHSQTPRSVRQSPMSSMAHIPQPQYPPQMQHQHSQPSTPLGPPPMQYQRPAMGSHPEPYSPYHQRNFSGASNGMIGGSPAQHHPAGGFVDSPSAYNRQSPHVRRTSDYLSQMDRERSVSVSPKTRIPPRIPSQGSRNSSLQETHSSRGSLPNLVAQPYEAHNHVHPSYPGGQNVVAQPSFTHAASDVSQTPLLTTPLSQSGSSAQPVQNTSLSMGAQSSQQPHQQQHQAQKMGMNHLLTPSSHSESMPSAVHDSATRRQSIDMLISPEVNSGSSAPPQQPQPIESEPSAAPVHDTRADTLLQQPVKPEPPADRQADHIPPAESRKRPADAESVAEPPLKREKRRKYTQRPPWAQLHRSNPRFVGAENPLSKQQNGMPNQRQQQPMARQQLRATPQPARATSQQPNGQHKVNGAADGAGLQHDQPLDNDLIHARSILGPWEKSFKWHTPAPDMLKILQDWIWATFAANADVGNDPRHGAFEIEAKIGTLCDGGTHDRVQLPVASMCVINPAMNSKYRFESQMEEPEHQAMNKFLNATVQETTNTPTRIPMAYRHLYETDTFSPLSPAGYAALPPSARRAHPPGRELRLRTSRNSKTHAIIAQIVKINLGDLHLYNPNAPYDARISINLEVNLDRPDLRYEDLVAAPGTSPQMPERRKDRLSYAHLAYSVDLTKVESGNASPKYELELEVDAKVLREQMRRAGAGEDHAYGDVVSGFLDNATFLMRQRSGH